MSRVIVPPATQIVPSAGFVQYLDSMGRDEDVIEAARTSTGRGFVSWEPYRRCEKCSLIWLPESSREHQPACVSGEHAIKEFPRGDTGLLEYLYMNRHMTPFEMCEIKLLVKAPIFIFRQWHRHRAASVNEMSARYTQLPDEFYSPRAEDVKGRSAINKQGSGQSLEAEDVEAFLGDVDITQGTAYREYKRALARGIAPEMARINLPGSIYSTMVWKTNLRMALHFLGLRDDSHAQGLMQEYARAVASFIAALWPRTYALYEEHTKYAVTFSRTERAALVGCIEHYVGSGQRMGGLEVDKLFTKLKGTAA